MSTLSKDANVVAKVSNPLKAQEEESMSTLSSRRELFFAYDIKMGNPNGDPDENRPRVLPDGTYYVTDVRLKRFIRDYFKMQGKKILVDSIDNKTTNLTGRVTDYLKKEKKLEANGQEIVDILLGAFLDARLFGSSFAFKKTKVTNEEGQNKDVELKPIPKTLTGAVQFNHGEVMHQAEAIDIHGTSIFASSEDKSQGTFTTYFALRYALIGFNAVANEHSAKLSKMTNEDYLAMLKAIWCSVRSAANTRSKVGQNPRLLISIEYKENEEFQFGNLSDYVALESTTGKPENQWAGPQDYQVDLSKLKEKIGSLKKKIKTINYCISPDIQFKGKGIDSEWKDLDFDGMNTEQDQQSSEGN